MAVPVEMLELALRQVRELLQRRDTCDTRDQLPFTHPSSDALPQLVLDPTERLPVVRLPEVCRLVIRHIQKITRPKTCLLRQQ